jgi:hypothetical protein
MNPQPEADRRPGVDAPHDCVKAEPLLVFVILRAEVGRRIPVAVEVQEDFRPATIRVVKAADSSPL